MGNSGRALGVAVCVALAVLCNAEAGPGEEEPGQQLPVDRAYQEHVQSIFSAIMMDQGKANVKYSDLNPQAVDIHTIAARIPALKIGMNALGHKMLHVHSDERGNKDRWSSEIMSSGATAGFTMTDRVKGLQKGDGKAGSQWTMYSSAKIFRLKDEAVGDTLHVQDGQLTLKGNSGKAASKPRLTIVGGKDSVPRVTLVSKAGDDSKFVSLYNRFGKFGVFSGALDKSIFHLTADGSEMALVSANVQPHITIESTAKGSSSQEVVLKGTAQTVKLFHKSGNLGFCGLNKNAKKCKTFYKTTANGERTDFISHTDKAVLKVSHSLRGGNTEVQLVSQDKVGVLTSTNIYNAAGTLGFHTKVKGAGKTLMTIAPNGNTNIFGRLNVKSKATIQKSLHVLGDVKVQGIVTMQGKNMGSMVAEMAAMKRASAEMQQRLEQRDAEFRGMEQRMTEMSQQNTALQERLESMMSSFQLMQARS